MTPTQQDNELREEIYALDRLRVKIDPNLPRIGSVMARVDDIVALITAHTNAEIAKVLDSLEGNSGNIDLCSYEDIQKAIPLDVIQAERAKLKEG